MKINRERLEENIYKLGEIGLNENDGIDRPLSSEADRQARKWLIDYWETKLNSQVRIDAIANMWVRINGDSELPPIVVGSHHDAVPNGGKYDGALGVLVATEIVELLLENKIKTRHPIEIVSFTGEEPNPFNVSTLGSKVLSGRLSKDDLLNLYNNKDGSTLEDCISKVGGDIHKADEILIKPNDIAAFIELHVEQGRRLYDKGQASATVKCITGIYRENISILGDANHGGTTNMPIRQDALLSASELNIIFEKLLLKEENPEVVGTIGYLDVFPNAVSIIPGRVDLTLEIRCIDEAIRKRIRDGLSKEIAKIENKRGVKIKREVNLDQKEMYMDKEVMEAITRGIEQTGEPRTEYVSMAGHDSSNMQRVTKAGMIFVQSKDGKSHCPSEYSKIQDIEKTANAMLEAVMILDKEMNL